MKSLIPAFSSPTPLCASRATPFSTQCCKRERPRPTRRKCTPRMVDAISLASELLAAAILGYGTYYLIFREPPNVGPTDEEQKSASPVDGVIGLSSSRRSQSDTAAVVAPDAPTLPLVDTIGVDINDYFDSGDGAVVDKQRRLEEELNFAADSLSDLYACDATIVIDAAGDVVWVQGDLVGDTSELGRLPDRVRETGKTESLNVTSNEILPFLKEEVRNAAVLPIGDQGAVLVIASRQKDFFGEVEQRVANAVCGRLANFLYVPPPL